MINPSTSLCTRSWFYIVAGGRREGPLSEEQVGNLILEGVIGRDAYLWTEGESQWRPVTSFRDFQKFHGNLAENSGPMTTLAQDVRRIQDRLLGKIDFANERGPRVEFQGARVRTAKSKLAMAVDTVNAHKRTNRKPYLSWLRGGLTVITLILLSAVVVWKLQPPKWKARLEARGIRGSVMKELAAAISTPLTKGRRLAVSVVQAESGLPVIHIGTNLKDGTRLRLRLKGERGTLVDQLTFQRDWMVVIRDGITSPPRLEMENGKRLPLGLYTFSLALFEEEAGAKQNPLWRARYFVGVEGEVYRTSLALFFERLRSQAEVEAAELQDLTATIDEQIRQYSIFDLKKKNRSWNRFKAKWGPVHEQLHAFFTQAQTPERVAEQLLRRPYAVLKRTQHLLETAFSQGPSDRGAHQVALTQAQNQIIDLRVQLARIQNEMQRPMRDSLLMEHLE